MLNRRYGAAEDLKLEEIDAPVLEPGHVIVRVRAASVNAGDWRLMRGWPRVARPMMGGLRGADPPVRGWDLAGVVESVADDVDDAARRRRGVRSGSGDVRRARDRACGQTRPETAVAFVRGRRSDRRRRGDGAAGTPRSRAGEARPTRARDRRGRRCRDIRSADREGLRRRSYGCLQRSEGRARAAARRRPRDRLCGGGLHARPASLRRDLRYRRRPLAARDAACARRGRDAVVIGGKGNILGPIARIAKVVRPETVRAPAAADAVPRAGEQRPTCSSCRR